MQAPMLLGKVDEVSDDGLLGLRYPFEDLDYSLTGVKKKLSNDVVEAILMRNESGGALAAGTLLKWDTGSTYGPPKAVGGAAGATDNAIGCVDPWISSAVPNDSFFWMIVGGPTKLLFTTGTALTVGIALLNAASGRAGKFTNGSSDATYKIGFAAEAVADSVANDTLFRAVLNKLY